MSGPYEDDAGRPVLKHSLAVFVDSLGTKKRAESLTDDGLRRLIRWQEEYRRNLSDEGMTSRALLAFTDNIIAGTTDTTDRSIFGLAYVSGMYQLGLLLHASLLSRGAITEGPLYVGPSLAHGLALVEAAGLEKDIVKFPRIILSGALRKRVDGLDFSSVTDLALERGGQLFLADSDGHHFVNYLAIPFFEHPRPHPSFGDRTAEDVMEEHAELIRNLLARPEAGELRSKLLWMVDYHNHVAGAMEVEAILTDVERSDEDAVHTFQAVGGIG